MNRKRRNKTGFFLGILLLFLGSVSVTATEQESEPNQLFATAACLMDGDTGRVLFGKRETDPMAMASTTKIMTCILALENGQEQTVATASAKAAAAPKVHLGVREGEQFLLALILPHFFGVMGVYYAEPIADVCSVITAVTLFLCNIRKILSTETLAKVTHTEE